MIDNTISKSTDREPSTKIKGKGDEVEMILVSFFAVPDLIVINFILL